MKNIAPAVALLMSSAVVSNLEAEDFTVESGQSYHITEALRGVTFKRSGAAWPMAYVYFDCGNNLISDLSAFSATWFWTTVDNAFDSAQVISFGLNVYKYEAKWDFRGHNQVADRIQSEPPCSWQQPENWEDTDIVTAYHNGATAATLTLKGTDDAYTYAKICDNLSIVWDPGQAHEQAFRDRENTMSGSFTVKKGAISIEGTSTFASVPSVRVEDGAVFKVSSSVAGSFAGLTSLVIEGSGQFKILSGAANPLAADTVAASLGTDSRIEIPAGMTISMKSLIVGGVPVAAGTYTSSTLAQVVGDGALAVAETAMVDFEVSSGNSYYITTPVRHARLVRKGAVWPWAYVYVDCANNLFSDLGQFCGTWFWIRKANAFCEEQMITFGEGYKADADNGSCLYQFNGYNQTADRIVSAPPYSYGDSEKWADTDLIKSSIAATLTLKGSADAITYAKLCDHLSIVWDPKGDYVQSCRDRVHTMDGSITVNGGTFRMEGTSTFAKVPTITVKDGATFEASVTSTGALAGLTTLNLEGAGAFKVTGSAADLFTSGTVAVKASKSSRFELPEGTTLSVRSIFVDGALPIVAGTYDASTCMLISGGGALVVAETASDGGDATIWTGAQGTAWENAANWTDGLPSATVRGIVSDGTVNQPILTDGTAAGTIGNVVFSRIAGTAVTVDVKTAADFSGGDFKIGSGATVKVASNGTFTWNAASRGVNYQTETSSIDADGALESAGTIDLNMTGQLAVRGLLSLSGGHMTVENNNGYAQLMVKNGGRLEASGNAVVDVKQTGGLDAEEGGSIAFSDDAVLNMPIYWQGIELGSADLTFSGCSQFVNPANAIIYFCPKAAGESFRLVFRDSARADLPSVEMRGRESGSLVEIDYGSDATNKVSNLIVGANYGTARLWQRCGALTLGSRLRISGGFIYGGYDTSADSQVCVTGGQLIIGGSSDYTSFSGLHIGDGSIADPKARKGSACLSISGGEVSQPNGPILVGSGCIPGRVVQTGGSFHNDSTYNNESRPVIIGYEGGSGEWIMSNGVFTTTLNVYVGGASSEDIIQTTWMTEAGYGTHHDAEGSLTVWSADASAPCSFQTSRSLIFGQDGTGTLAMGPAGEISAGDVVFANGSASFVFGEQGVGSVTASRTLTVTDGTRLNIDATACLNWDRRKWLFRCRQMDGSFTLGDVKLADADKKDVELRQSATGVYLHKKRGMSVIIK